MSTRHESCRGYGLRRMVEGYRTADLDPVRVIDEVLSLVAVEDGDYNAFVFVDEEGAREAAEASAERWRRGEPLSPLDGIPVAVKDNICTRGVSTRCASRILEGYSPVFDATVVARLREAGAVIVGKTNLDEFAMGSSNEYSIHGPVRNPWSPRHVPGGSSGGSAAAVCAGYVPCALGSDTGGSIRLPASFCGITGLKPTYGRVSRYGLVAFASSLDQIGPMAGDVEDCMLLYAAIAGRDPLDSTTLDEEVWADVDRVASIDRLEGVTVGVVEEFLGEGLAPGVRECFERAMEELESIGARVVRVSLPHVRYSVAVYYIVACAEASSNLARYDGVRYGRRTRVPVEDVHEMMAASRTEGFGDEVKRRIVLGTFVLSSGYYDAYYLEAQKVRRAIADDFSRAFSSADCLVTPVSPVLPWRLGEKLDDPLSMYLADICTTSVNLAGAAAISVPCGFAPDEDGVELPVGIQFIAPPLQEKRLFEAAAAYQHSTSYHLRRPWKESDGKGALDDSR